MYVCIECSFIKVGTHLTCSSNSEFFKDNNLEVDILILKELANVLCKFNP